MGAVRKIDDLGRLVLPRELREMLGWQSEEPIEIELLDQAEQTVLLRAAKPSCAFCQKRDDILKMVGLGFICPQCIAQVKQGI